MREVRLRYPRNSDAFPRQTPVSGKQNPEAGLSLNPVLCLRHQLEHLQVHPDLKEPGRGKTDPSATSVQVAPLPAKGFLVPLPTLKEQLLVSRVSAGRRGLADGGGAEAGFAGTTVQLLLQLQSQTVVHLDALLQLRSQGSDLCHQVAQVTAQRDLVAGIPGIS